MSGRRRKSSYVILFLLMSQGVTLNGVLASTGDDACASQKKTDSQNQTTETPRPKDRKYGQEVTVYSSYDRLTNNKGIWRSHSILNKSLLCDKDSIYFGMNRAERFNIIDEALLFGGAVNFNSVSLEMDYQHGQKKSILPDKAISGLLSIKTGSPVNILIPASKRQYSDLTTRSAGLGVDIYFSDYQLLLMVEETDYSGNFNKADSSSVVKIQFGYYFASNEFIRFTYINGEELVEDGSDSPPFSNVETFLLTSQLSLSNRSRILFELKQYELEGYYKQHGLGLAYRYQY